MHRLEELFHLGEYLAEAQYASANFPRCGDHISAVILGGFLAFPSFPHGILDVDEHNENNSPLLMLFNYSIIVQRVCNSMEIDTNGLSV